MNYIIIFILVFFFWRKNWYSCFTCMVFCWETSTWGSKPGDIGHSSKPSSMGDQRTHSVEKKDGFWWCIIGVCMETSCWGFFIRSKVSWGEGGKCGREQHKRKRISLQATCSSSCPTFTSRLFSSSMTGSSLAGLLQ